MNELTFNNLKFTVDYTPSKLTIANEAELADLVSKTATSYASLVFNDSNIADAKKARAELNKVSKIIEDKRKDIKRDYSKELDAFETKMKGYSNQIKQVSDTIKSGLDKYEEQERVKRHNKICEVIVEIIVNTPMDINDFDVEGLIDSSWLNATAFTKSGEPTLSTLKNMQSKIGWAMQQVKQRQADIATVTKIAELNGLEPYAWTRLLDNGLDATTILSQIDEAVAEKETARLIAEQCKAEQEAEHNRQLADATNVDDKKVDTDTGEILETAKHEEKIMMFDLRVKGTFLQLSHLNQFMRDNRIEFVKIGG